MGEHITNDTADKGLDSEYIKEPPKVKKKKKKKTLNKIWARDLKKHVSEEDIKKTK